MSEQQEKVFTDGLIYKLPRDGAPDFVKGSLSVKVDEFKAFLDQHVSNGWVNIDLLIGKSGKPYGALNTWKPREDVQESEQDDSIPF